MKANQPNDLWKYVEYGPDCWNWLGHKNAKRYGRFKVRQQFWFTHRLVAHLSFGKIPDGMHVLHKCDNPSCVRPDHLWFGTNKDNVEDKLAKRRHRFQDRDKCSKGHLFDRFYFDQTRKHPVRGRCSICEHERYLRFKNSPAYAVEMQRRRDVRRRAN